MSKTLTKTIAALELELKRTDLDPARRRQLDLRLLRFQAQAKA